MTEQPSCAGLRIFAVEDESLVAMQLEDILADLGCEIVGLAMRVPRALAMLDGSPKIDAAVLDMNIAGEKVYPVAERLRDGGVPIIFATGYGVSGIAEEWRSWPILQKPYTGDQVESALMRALSLHR
ncbi:response regulator [Aureimonas pseudogalii]|uniref:CheY-like chemotaxis protein n=1 Tax=Aureimonas pseudogalii TaxID=1744844 RepID=A0A7W6EGU7_9HYPH|nr:response regulator [Aureimonas pseudogalii]MBB3998113.1 CheY-like chemotaxis protein [Aureimonas pseudogalii]